MTYDALLVVSFGGPEGPADVMPFLRNTVAGRGIPDERLAVVAQHYQHFGGVSPINGQCRDLVAAVRAELASQGIALPVYWGNRNWHPMLAETIESMRRDGVQRALAFITSPYASFSSCRQYLYDIEVARSKVGPGAPGITKLRHYHDHPGFIAPHTDGVKAALASLGAAESRPALVFTAHSIPLTMQAESGPGGGRYLAQLNEVARLVAAGLGGVSGVGTASPYPYELVFQSRSGSPRVPWLAPDINEQLAALAQRGVESVVVSPIGFISDHLEVCWDLDIEAAATALRLGLRFARSGTPGTDPRFISMIVELVRERLDSVDRPESVGQTDGVPPACSSGCCLPRRTDTSH